MTVVTLELHELAYGGDAVGRYEGQVVFVPGGLPGEVARVRLVEMHKRHARAQLLEVLTPAPERVTPPCCHFGVCGGCHLQHVDYAAQLRFKRDIVRSLLRGVGKQAEPVVRPMIGMEHPWDYRNHVQLKVGPEGQLGYQGLRSHAIVPVDHCPIAHPLVREIWVALQLDFPGLTRISLRAGTATGEQMVIFEGSGVAPALEVDMPVSCLYQLDDGKLIVMTGKSYYYEKLGDRIWRISALSFFQVNTAQAERMIGVINNLLPPHPGESLLDAYCGVGTFGLNFAAQGARVIGIEESPWAIQDALANRRAEESADFIAGRVEEIFPKLDETFDAVLLDPPRTGCAPVVLKALVETSPQRVLYISCDPATLARDIAYLSLHGYRLVEVQPIDMFPQTYHIECVALLTRAPF